jgi:hypothetical protein
LPSAGNGLPVAAVVTVAAAAPDLRSPALPAIVKAVAKLPDLVESGEALMPPEPALATVSLVCGGLANTGMFAFMSKCKQLPCHRRRPAFD